MAKAKITKSVTHDRLAVKAVYANGEGFSFSVSRSGERYSIMSCSSPDSRKAEAKSFGSFVSFLPGEKNGERIDRIHSVAKSVDNYKDFIHRIIRIDAFSGEK